MSKVCGKKDILAKFQIIIELKNYDNLMKRLLYSIRKAEIEMILRANQAKITMLLLPRSRGELG